MFSMCSVVLVFMVCVCSMLWHTTTDTHHEHQYHSAHGQMTAQPNKTQAHRQTPTHSTKHTHTPQSHDPHTHCTITRKLAHRHTHTTHTPPQHNKPIFSDCVRTENHHQSTFPHLGTHEISTHSGSDKHHHKHHHKT